MIVQKQVSDTLIETYSDIGMMIHGGYPEGDYVSAIDPISAGRTYTETDIPIEGDVAGPEDFMEALERLGVSTDEEADS